jgi:Zinc knuckle
MTPAQPRKGDTSKLTCFKCGKVGHIATDPKCPQYKKSAQRQMFAAQVLDDRSDTDLPITNKPSEESEGINDAEFEPESSDKQEEQSDQDDHSDGPDGSQYNEDNTPCEEYNGYSMPSESDGSEVEYIRAMNEASSSAALQQSGKEEWEF